MHVLWSQSPPKHQSIRNVREATSTLHTLSVKRMRPWPSGRTLPPGERGEVPLAAVGLVASSLERSRTGDTASWPLGLQAGGRAAGSKQGHSECLWISALPSTLAAM